MSLSKFIGVGHMMTCYGFPVHNLWRKRLLSTGQNYPQVIDIMLSVFSTNSSNPR